MNMQHAILFLSFTFILTLVQHSEHKILCNRGRLIAFRGLPTRMVYLYYISCLRYTILAGNPQFDKIIIIIIIIMIMIIIMTLRSAIPDFVQISSLLHKLPPTPTLKWSGCNHVHITCNTCVARGMKEQLSYHI